VENGLLVGVGALATGVVWLVIWGMNFSTSKRPLRLDHPALHRTPPPSSQPEEPNLRPQVEAQLLLGPLTLQCSLLESKLENLQSEFRSLKLEWSQAHRHLDHLLRRGIRLGVLEQKQQAEESPGESSESLPPGSPSQPSRSQLLQSHKARSQPH